MIIGRTPDTLIAVPGHATLLDGIRTIPDDIHEDRHWSLQSFQKGEPLYYMQHMQVALGLLDIIPNSFLMFSGGRTRLDGGHWGEAASYAAVAEHFDYWNTAAGTTMSSVEDRIGMEAHAADSLQNVQFSLYRFHQLFGRYPGHVVVPGWPFKERRFRQHATALGIVEDQFTYIGCTDPPDLDMARAGEAKACAAFAADPLGDHGELAAKRDARNPFRVPVPYICMPELVLPQAAEDRQQGIIAAGAMLVAQSVGQLPIVTRA